MRSQTRVARGSSLSNSGEHPRSHPTKRRWASLDSAESARVTLDEIYLLNPGYKAGVAFAIMIGMLLWRPTGLFKGKVF